MALKMCPILMFEPVVRSTDRGTVGTQVLLDLVSDKYWGDRYDIGWNGMEWWGRVQYKKLKT